MRRLDRVGKGCHGTRHTKKDITENKERARIAEVEVDRLHRELQIRIEDLDKERNGRLSEIQDNLLVLFPCQISMSDYIFDRFLTFNCKPTTRGLGLG